MNVTLQDQINCIRRELVMRTVFYPQLVRQGKLRSREAEWELACMEAVLETLEDSIRRRNGNHAPPMKISIDE